MLDYRQIEGYPDYILSNEGKIYSKKRSIWLSLLTNSDGYKQVGLWENKKGKKFKVHRLVAQHFIDNPDNKECIDHINRIRDDNRVENLRWVTKHENNKNREQHQNNTSGYTCIHKRKDKTCKQGFNWIFSVRIDTKKTLIKSSTTN